MARACQHSQAAYNEKELWVWRRVGVEKLLSGGVRLEGVDREEPEA